MLRGLNSEALEAALCEQYSIANQPTKSLCISEVYCVAGWPGCRLAHASTQAEVRERHEGYHVRIQAYMEEEATPLL